MHGPPRDKVSRPTGWDELAMCPEHHPPKAYWDNRTSSGGFYGAPLHADFLRHAPRGECPVAPSDAVAYGPGSIFWFARRRLAGSSLRLISAGRPSGRGDSGGVAEP